jgi:predicted phage tail protein
MASDLSEQAKVTYIQGKIKEARSRVIAGSISVVFGAVLLAFAVAFSFLKAAAWSVGGIASFLIVYGLALCLYYDNQRNILIMQLKGRAFKTPTCRNCGKPIPQGNHASCPFCGSALVSPTPPSVDGS